MSVVRIPVTLVSGFLGAGKTTLVNHLVAQRPDETIGVIVNEFGEVGIDGALIVADDNPVIEITNGCICCTVRTDLPLAVREILRRSLKPIDRLIVETSGLADPAPVLQTFLADPEMLQTVELESVVTVVDAAHVCWHIGDEIVREQIAFADVVVLNKMELVSVADMQRLECDIRRLNPAAQLVQSRQARLPAHSLLGTKRFSLSDVLAIEPDLLSGEDHAHEHDTTIESLCLVSMDALDPRLFNRWINQLVQRDGREMLRMKGVLCFEGEARRFFFHGVHMLLDARPAGRWKPDETRQSKLVFIGRALDAESLRDGFLACTASSSLIPS